MENVLRDDQSKQLLDSKPFSCKCDKLNGTTTESILSENVTMIDDVTDNVTGVEIDETTEVASDELPLLSVPTDVVPDDISDVVPDENTDDISIDITHDVVTDESVNTEEPILSQKDNELTISDSKQNETESDNHLIPENDYPDYDYTPVNGSALQQLVSFVYLNNNTNQVPYKPEKKLKKKVIKQTKKAVNIKSTLATKKVSNKAVNRAATGTTPKTTIGNTKRQKPDKKLVTTKNSVTKSKLGRPGNKPATKSRLRIQQETSVYDNSGLNTNRAIADDIPIEASEFETKFRNLESIPFDILGLDTKFKGWDDIPFEYSGFSSI